MKIKITVALFATATFIILSCNWFRSKKKEVSNPLVGVWNIDSIKQGKDTGVVHSLLIAAMKDTLHVNVTFTKDSLFTHCNDTFDTVCYLYDEKTNQLKIKDSSNESFAYNKINDSLITLTSKDSAILFLQKK